MPGVTVAGDETLRAVAATCLPAADVALPAEPLERYAWDRLTAGVRVQRLQGLLAEAVRTGVVPVTATQQAEAADLHREAMASVGRIERGLVAAARALSAAGVETVVLKGSAAAHLDYPDPTLRVFGDADLLVRTEALPGAVDALRSARCTRPRPDPRRGANRRVGKAVELVDPDGVQVDLHRICAPEPYGLLVDPGELFAETEPFTVGGETLQALAAPARFLLACYQAVLGVHPVRLVPLRDAAGIITSGRLDREAVIAQAERWQGGAVVARAVGLAWRAFGLDPADPLARWAADRPESRGEHDLLAPFGAESRQQANRTLATLRLLKGTAAKAAYLRAVLLPGRRGSRAFARPR